MDDIDADTLEKYRIMFNGWNPEHIWRELPDKEFLEMLGSYRRNRRDNVEGLTAAGLLMFGTGLAIRDRFDNGFSFSNPRNLKLPKEQIYRGEDSKARNPHMQTMLRMVGFSDNACSGFPEILKVWDDNGWEEPALFEDTVLNQVTLTLKESAESVNPSESADLSAESAEKSAESLAEYDDRLSDRHKQILLFMKDGEEYSTEEMAEHIGLKGPRTR